MTVATQATPRKARTEGGFGWLEANLPKIVLAPSVALTLVFVYGFILWTVYLPSRSRGWCRTTPSPASSNIVGCGTFRTGMWR
jgi:hypothetical protein